MILPQGSVADASALFRIGATAPASASAYGAGGLFAALPVLIYQGALVVFAGGLQPWPGPAVMTGLAAAGGALVIGIGLNMPGLARIPLSNMLPSLPIAAALAACFA